MWLLCSRLGENGVEAHAGLSWGPAAGGGVEVFTSTPIEAGTTLFTVPSEVAVRVDSPHTDFRTRFAADLLNGTLAMHFKKKLGAELAMLAAVTL